MHIEDRLQTMGQFKERQDLVMLSMLACSSIRDVICIRAQKGSKAR